VHQQDWRFGRVHAVMEKPSESPRAWWGFGWSVSLPE
jgi:hypothetical protein